jgi:ATP-dependent Lhr-like helicase
LGARAKTDVEALEHVAKALLRRYGVMCRRLLAREPLAPSWRELLPFYRTAEARGEIRGGRFIEPFGGEQFALIEAVEELRRLRRQPDANEWVVLAAADPASLLGSTDDAPRAPVPNRRLVFHNGAAVAARAAGTAVEWLAQLTPSEQNHATDLLSKGELEWLKPSPAAVSAAPSVTRSRRT